MKILVCIDDTDNLESKGTGALAQQYMESVTEQMGGSRTYISRHQLYVHDDVPYTSHNSAMCFESDIPENRLDDVIEMGVELLRAESAPGSDPGLCVVAKEEILHPAELVAYGRSAKCTLLTKEQAYSMALLQGMHLSEHGGTGQGIVGAVAGVALRYFGNDGRVKGKVEAGKEGEIKTVAELLETTCFERVLSLDGQTLSLSEQVTLTESKLKAVLLGWQKTLLVKKNDGSWHTLSKEQHRCY